MDNSERFIVISKQVFNNNWADSIEILKDTKTGVLYIFRSRGNSGGLTVLVDQNGKPLTSY